MGMNIKISAIVPVLSLAVLLGAPPPELRRAQDLYNRTEYKASLAILSRVASQDAKVEALLGQDYFMLGEYKKATDHLQQAFSLEPSNSEYAHWLGRTYGRRAETSGPFTAPGNASKARQYFERAVELDAHNGEALNDLFDYYLQAPGFLGGGFDKASEVAKKIAALDAAEGHFAQAQLADKRKQFDAAEQQLRRAMELAPRQVGRVLDLARYLARHGQYQESEAAFRQAEKLAPNSPKVLFARARTYVEEKRNLDEAKVLLKKYLESKLTPDDPSREEAQKLLRKAEGA
jgi:Flp pilus assembly protein TadD